MAGFRHEVTVLIMIAAAAVIATHADAHAQSDPASHQAHDTQTHEHGVTTPLLCAICPSGREAAGTSWQPDIIGDQHHSVTRGDWQLGLHGQVAAVRTDERGPRGDDGWFSTNHIMGSARRPLGPGVFGIQSMWSLEPSMGPRGYPLLLQTGETSDGLTPLIDRQHPHDFAMELAVTYARPIGTDQGMFLYVAAVGAPAFGPPAFMHRASASTLPIAPITHHWFDSTHISHGVITMGFNASPVTKFEISGFKGRESDEHRWDLESPRLDSFAARLSINPRPSLALQASLAYLKEPEQLHPGANAGRFSVSAMYSARWSTASLDTTVAWSRNNRTTGIIPVPGGAFVFPGAVTHALLGEATLRVASRHALVTRLEYAGKDELFPVTDARHNTRFPIGRSTAGYALDFFGRSYATLSVGSALSWTHVGEDLRAVYGGPPVSFLVFLGLRTH